MFGSVPPGTHLTHILWQWHMIKRVYRLNRTANGRVIVQPFDKILLDEHNKYRSQQNASDMQKLEWDQDLADGAQEYVESCECQALCEHGFAPDTSGRYGEKDWFHLGFRDDHRFGQNLFFSYLDEDKRTSEPVKNWQGEIVQYHYVSTQTIFNQIISPSDPKTKSINTSRL